MQKHLKSFCTAFFLIFLPVIVSAQGSFFAGGSVSISGLSQQDNGKDHSAFEFTISPDFCLEVGKKLQTGLFISYSTVTGDVSPVADDCFQGFSFCPYLRYNVLSFGKADIWIEGSAKLGFQWMKDSIFPNRTFDLSILPLLTYPVDEHFILFSKLGFLSLGYSNSEIHTNDYDESVSSSNFGFLVDSSNLCKIGELSIGIMYRFNGISNKRTPSKIIRRQFPAKTGFQQNAEITLNISEPAGVGISYTAGNRFNNHLFLGAGIGLDYAFGEKSTLARIFAAPAYYFTSNRISPVIGLRIGAGYFYYEGCQDHSISPTTSLRPGIAIHCNNSTVLNISLDFGNRIYRAEEGVSEYFGQGFSVGLSF